MDEHEKKEWRTVKRSQERELMGPNKEIFLHELSPNTSFLHSINKKMIHVINFIKNVILIKEMEP